MGVSTLDGVLEHVRNENLYDLLAKSKEDHTKLGSLTHEYLNDYHDDGKEPAAMAQMMSWMKTNMKLGGEQKADHMAADLVTDGCNKGVKSLCRYLNQYLAASEKVKDLTKDIVRIEESLVKDLREYL